MPLYVGIFFEKMLQLTYLITINQFYFIMTNIKSKFLKIIAGSFLFSLALISCKKDDNNSGSGNTEFKVTDAPIDDASVSGAFVTIADIKLDGVSVQGFTKTTVDLAAYQNGSTKTIGNFNLEGRTYNSVTFVLDHNMDASGNTPGCYILTTNGTKHALQAASDSIVIAKSFDINSSVSNSIVADFDLRKMIIRQTGNASDQYDFATNAELQTSVRIVAETKTGIVSGMISDAVSNSTKVVAYAYKVGTYNRITEMQAQGASGIQFKNAVASSTVNASGQFSFHFLEAGNYEIHFASYKDTNADGQLELVGTLIVLPSVGSDFLNLVLGVNATVSLQGSVTGVLN